MFTFSLAASLTLAHCRALAAITATTAVVHTSRGQGHPATNAGYDTGAASSTPATPAT